jgi:hypothetical protein
MKKQTLLTVAFAALTFASVTFSGCKKDNEDNLSVTPKTQSSDNGSEANENFIASSSFDDAAGMMTYGVARTAFAGTLITLPVNFPENIVEAFQAPCATVTYGLPNTATIDFGPGCTDNNGNHRSGLIKIQWRGDITDVGTVYSITFNNYYFNYNKIEGTVEVTNQGRNSAHNITFNVVANGSVTVLDPSVSSDKSPASMRYAGKTMTYSSYNTIEWIARTTNDNIEPQRYLIHGRSEGKTLDGRLYSTQILVPLNKEKGFPFYTNGTQQITFKGGDVRTVDYGYYNQQQDDLASVILGNNVEVIIHLNRNPLMIANIH